MNKITQITLSLCTIGALSSLSALEFQSIGYKANSMGGTGVSNPSSAAAVYMNPAMLAFTKSKFENDFGVGISVQDRGLIPSIDALEKTNFNALLDKATLDVTSLTVDDKANIINASNIIGNMNGNSVSVSPELNIGLQIGSFGIGAFGSGEITGRTIVDSTRTALYVENGGSYYDLDGNVVNQATYEATSLEYAINNGLTRFDLNGLLIGEVPVGYGHMFQTKYGKLAVGGALKYMTAESSFNNIQLNNYDTLKDNFDKNIKSSSTFGIDLGLGFKPTYSENITLGLVTKNINTPKFDTVNGKYKVDPMIKAGISYDWANAIEVAIDYDISKNKSLNKDFSTQYLGFGINYHQFSWFSLRAGLKSNLADSNSGVIYTAGLGVGPQFLHLEVAGEMSSKTNTISGSDVPAYAKGTLSLVSTF